MKGLKERIEDGSLKIYLETLLTGCLGSDTNTVVHLDFAHRLGSSMEKNKRGRDRDVLLRFSDQKTQNLVLDHLWDTP